MKELNLEVTETVAGGVEGMCKVPNSNDTSGQTYDYYYYGEKIASSSKVDEIKDCSPYA